MKRDGFSESSEAGNTAGRLPQCHVQPQPFQLDEWRKAHAAVLAGEHRFAELVARYPGGEVSLHELRAAREELQAVRELADAVLRKALA